MPTSIRERVKAKEANCIFGSCCNLLTGTIVGLLCSIAITIFTFAGWNKGWWYVVSPEAVDTDERISTLPFIDYGWLNYCYYENGAPVVDWINEEAQCETLRDSITTSFGTAGEQEYPGSGMLTMLGAAAGGAAVITFFFQFVYMCVFFRLSCAKQVCSFPYYRVYGLISLILGAALMATTILFGMEARDIYRSALGDIPTEERPGFFPGVIPCLNGLVGLAMFIAGLRFVTCSGYRVDHAINASAEDDTSLMQRKDADQEELGEESKEKDQEAADKEEAAAIRAAHVKKLEEEAEEAEKRAPISDVPGPSMA